MIIKGKVEAVSGIKVIVNLEKNDLVENNKVFSNIMINNILNAKTGDKVEVIATERNYNILIKFLYILPIVFLIGGILIGLLLQNELFQFSLAIGLFAVSMFIMIFLVNIINKIPKTIFIMKNIINKEISNE